jgi:hypothetical protein
MEGTSYITTDSLLYDRCEISIEPREVKNKIKERNSNSRSLENKAEAIY